MIKLEIMIVREMHQILESNYLLIFWSSLEILHGSVDLTCIKIKKTFSILYCLLNVNRSLLTTLQTAHLFIFKTGEKSWLFNINFWQKLKWVAP